MADFYPILARAVAGLPDTSPAARQAIYDRARAALVAQLRSLDPPLGEAEIMRERLSLDEAVARIEADYDDTPLRFESEALDPPLEAGPALAEPVAPALAPVPPRAAASAAESTEADFREPQPEVADTQPVRPRIAPPR
ncbi:MAG: histidine kinase, partial [Bosea sp. (in: a-proteobacteria)]|nr:histidine kinase [Bosea sp. (in: a-proteobacteria)]